MNRLYENIPENARAWFTSYFWQANEAVILIGSLAGPIIAGWAGCLPHSVYLDFGAL